MVALNVIHRLLITVILTMIIEIYAIIMYFLLFSYIACSCSIIVTTNHHHCRQHPHLANSSPPEVRIQWTLCWSLASVGFGMRPSKRFGALFFFAFIACTMEPPVAGGIAGGGGGTSKTQWQDLTFCHFYPFRVCKFAFGYFLFALGLWFH